MEIARRRYEASAASVLALQNPDGTWGSQFHTLSMPDRRRGLITTEQALRRLKILGYTLEDEPIRRAVDCMTRCLRGERKIDGYWEKGHDWALFTKLMLSAWVREFCPDEPLALDFAKKWARVMERTFADGTYAAGAYREAYGREFHSPVRGGRERDFVDFYHVSLLKGMLTPETEDRFLHYVMGKPEGIYYICGPVGCLPEEFASRETVRYLSGVELLSGYALAAEKLGFAADWMEENRDSSGQWDLGPKAKDGVHLPLSESWRRKGARQADCTQWVGSILARLRRKEDS